MGAIVLIPAAALAAYLSTCAPDVSPSTMRAIISVESGGNPWALNDNTTRHSYGPRDRASAAALAQTLINRGDSVDVGLAQVNSQNFAAFRVDAAAMLEPCQNLTVAARILGNDYVRAAATFAAPREALWHAISAYNTGSLFAGRPYVDKVVAAASRVPSVPPIGVLLSAPPTLAPIMPPISPATLVGAHAPSSSHRPVAIEAPLSSARMDGITRTLNVEISHGHR